MRPWKVNLQEGEGFINLDFFKASNDVMKLHFPSVKSKDSLKVLASFQS